MPDQTEADTIRDPTEIDYESAIFGQPIHHEWPRDNEADESQATSSFAITVPVVFPDGFSEETKEKHGWAGSKAKGMLYTYYEIQDPDHGEGLEDRILAVKENAAKGRSSLVVPPSKFDEVWRTVEYPSQWLNKVKAAHQGSNDDPAVFSNAVYAVFINSSNTTA